MSAVPTVGAPTLGLPRLLRWEGDDPPDAPDPARPRGRARPGPAGVLRAVGGRPQRGRRLPARGRAPGADPPPVPGDAGAVAARDAVGQGALRPPAARPGHALPAAQAARGGRAAAPRAGPEGPAPPRPGPDRRGDGAARAGREDPRRHRRAPRHAGRTVDGPARGAHPGDRGLPAGPRPPRGRRGRRAGGHGRLTAAAAPVAVRAVTLCAPTIGAPDVVAR